METLEQLREDLALTERARDYLSTRRHWTRNKLYAKGFVWPVVATRDTATRGCAMGVLYLQDPGAEEVYGISEAETIECAANRVIDRMEGYVYELSDGRVNQSVGTFNDRFGYAKVLDLFDLTIGALRKEIARLEETRAGLTEPSIPIQVPEPAREPRYVPLPDVTPNTAPGPNPDPTPVTVPEEDPDLVPA